jgi:hypothetical protein
MTDNVTFFLEGLVSGELGNSSSEREREHQTSRVNAAQALALHRMANVVEGKEAERRQYAEFDAALATALAPLSWEEKDRLAETCRARLRKAVQDGVDGRIEDVQAWLAEMLRESQGEGEG